MTFVRSLSYWAKKKKLYTLLHLRIFTKIFQRPLPFQKHLPFFMPESSNFQHRLLIQYKDQPFFKEILKSNASYILAKGRIEKIQYYLCGWNTLPSKDILVCKNLTTVLPLILSTNFAQWQIILMRVRKMSLKGTFLAFLDQANIRGRHHKMILDNSLCKPCNYAFQNRTRNRSLRSQ